MDNSFHIFIHGIKNKTIVHTLKLSNTILDVYNYLNNKYGFNNKIYYIIHGTKILDPIDKTFYDFNLNLTERQKVKKDSTFRINFRCFSK